MEEMHRQGMGRGRQGFGVRGALMPFVLIPPFQHLNVLTNPEAH